MKQKKFKLGSYLLLPIIFLAIVLRFFLLDKLPPSLNWDEVSHGYNAYSILKTGKDEWGKLLPVTNFRAYGDYPLPLNLYITIPSIIFLGLNEFSIRAPHATLGVLTVIATYYFAFGITKKRNIGLLASLLVTVDPWTLFTSRFVLQSNLSVFFLTTAAAFFFNREKNKTFLPLSALSFGLTLFSYHTTRIFSPIFLLALCVIYKNEVISIFSKSKESLGNIKRNYLATLFLLLIFFIPLPFILMNPEARARSNMVFLVDEGAILKIIDARNNSPLPALVKKIIFNRPTYFAFNFTKNYLGYFSPEFLFLKGGTQYQFSIPNIGLMHAVNLPFFFIGLVVMVNKARMYKKYKVILVWLLLSPIPASITQEKFAVLRSTPMLPIPQIISAIGLFFVLAWLRDGKHFEKIATAISIIYVAGLVYGVERYVTKYITEYPVSYSWAWQVGYKEVVNYAKENYHNYDKIIFTKKYGEPHEFVLFYWPWDPNSYRNDPSLNRFFQSRWYWVDGFDKFLFVNDWQVQEMKLESGDKVDCNNIKCLLITSPGNVPSDWRKLNQVDFLDGQPAFEIYANH